MKIEKQIETWVDVVVDISIDDIIQAINELPLDDDFHVKRGITSCWHYLRAVPDAVISAMTPQAKETIHKALLEQAQRFSEGKNGDEHG